MDAEEPYTIESITLNAKGIQDNIKASDKGEDLMRILTDQEQRVVFVYGSSDNMYLGSARGFFNQDGRDPACLDCMESPYTMLVLAYGPDVDVSYQQLVDDLYLELDSDVHRWRQGRSKRVKLSSRSECKLSIRPNRLCKQSNWKKYVNRDNKDVSVRFSAILKGIWRELYADGHGYVIESTPKGFGYLLLQKYSPSVSLDKHQTSIVKDICDASGNSDHVIFGGAGTGKTLLMLRSADALSRKRGESVYIVTQGNCSDEFKALVQNTGDGNVKVDNLGQFTQRIADKLLFGALEKPFVDTVFVDEAHNLPSFKKGQYGKTNYGFRVRGWEYNPGRDDEHKEDAGGSGDQRKSKQMSVSLRQFFDGSPREPQNSGCEKVKDYIDFLEFLKDNKYINRIVLCYDEDQWVYSGAVARIEEFTTSDNADIATYHGHEFKAHRLHNQYRILGEDGQAEKGTDYVTGIRTFLQLEPRETQFKRDVFQECEFHGADNWESADKLSYFGIVDSIADLFDYVNIMYRKHPGSHNRVVAGDARNISEQRIDPALRGEERPERIVWFDTDKNGIEDRSHGWAWNDKQEGFVLNSMKEDRYRQQVGSIFAVQGIDLNYVGVIIADDIAYDEEADAIIGVPENYKHRTGMVSKSLLKSDPELFHREFNKQIRGIYYTLMTRGINGVRFYFMDDGLKQHFMDFMGIRP